jgi:hypothetical protein
MEECPGWKADSYSLSHEIQTILWNPKFHFGFTTLATDHYLVPSNFFRCILILSSHLRLRILNGLLPSGIPTRILLCLLVGFLAYCLNVKMPAVRFSVTSVNFYHTTRGHIIQNSNIHSHCRENLKSNIFSIKQYINAIKVKSYPCNRPWRLWDVEAPTFSLDNRLTDGGEVVSLTRRPTFTP